MSKKTLVSSVIILIIAVSYYITHRTQLQLQHHTVLSAQVISQMYPDPNLTPGDVFPDVTANDICRSGYSKQVRNVSVSIKREVYQEYGVAYPQQRGAYEVDHFIPLELGGSNDIKNLWLEPASPTPGFHQKDIVENYLHDRVCHSGENLTQAQEEIRTNWYTVYSKIPNPQQYDFGGF